MRTTQHTPLAAKKLKSTVQKLVETVRDYDKRWKDLLSRIDYVIDEQLLIQWFLAGISQKI